MAYIEVEIDIDENLSEATTEYLIMELRLRHRVVLDETNATKKSNLKETLWI